MSAALRRLLPRENRLLVVRDASMAPGECDFAKLVQDRSGGRMHERIEDRDRQHESVTFRDLSQHGDLGFLEFGEWYDVELFDLSGVRAEGLTRLRPDDDGRHPKA